ncbi:uncharacterized protein METZ01_LOCUS209009 [marine metagenome]|uniref:Uncharacterized protein n=1 Tax=marine metagenome TaxID=408172 RepID=A0A382F0E8_9ZZZZ
MALGLMRENGSRIKVDSVAVVVSTEVITMVELGLRKGVVENLSVSIIMGGYRVAGAFAMQTLILVGEVGGNTNRH